MKCVALYVRVSTREQRDYGLSVSDQIESLQKYCQENDLYIYRIYNDAGISARKSYKHRPALLELIRDCKAKKIDLILVTKLDRFFRSVSDYYKVMDEIGNVPWRAIREDYETETPDGIFKVNIMLSVAQSEADKTSQRLKDTFKYKKERGDYVGSAPCGYKLKGRDLLIDDAVQKAVSEMFRTYLLTWSSAKAIDVAHANGLPISRSSFQKMVKNPVYCGTSRNGYKSIPYITESEFKRMQEVKRARTVSTEKTHVYLFSCMLNCGICGHRMVGKTAVRNYKQGRTTYAKYVCDQSRGESKHHLQIVERKLEDYLLSEVDNIIANKRIQASFEIKGRTERIAQKKRLEAKLERLTEVYVDGLIEKEKYQKQKSELQKEIDTIAISENDGIPTLPENWQEIYKDLTLENRAAFWKGSIRRITIYKDRDPVVEFL